MVTIKEIMSNDILLFAAGVLAAAIIGGGIILIFGKRFKLTLVLLGLVLIGAIILMGSAG